MNKKFCLLLLISIVIVINSNSKSLDKADLFPIYRINFNSTQNSNRLHTILQLKKYTLDYWKSVANGNTYTDYLSLTGGTVIGQINASVSYQNEFYGTDNSSPSSSINVVGTGNGRAFGYGPSILFSMPANTDGTNLWAQARILGSPDNNNNYDANGALFFQTRSWYNPGVGGYWNWRTNMVMRASGNIGIGTSDPGSKLEIAGDLKTTNFGANWDNLRIWSEGVSSFIQSNGDEEGLHIRSNTANKIILESNVGIGTSFPTELLTVNGNIRAKKLIVTQNGWADFVFNDDYPLRTISELEIYIKTKKHLPDIPSTQEVRNNGLDVGENQTLLLKKIEELTLYLIAINKRVAKLEYENKLLINKYLIKKQN